MLFLKKLINNKYQDSFLKETETFKTAWSESLNQVIFGVS